MATQSLRYFTNSLVASTLGLMAIGLLFVLPGCAELGLQSPFVSSSGAQERPLGPGRLTQSDIQSEVMSYTDTFNAAITEEWNDVAALGRDESTGLGLASSQGDRGSRLRRAALETKISNVSASLSIATSPNPVVGLVDMITLVTLQRMVLETPESGNLYGPELQVEIVRTYRSQEDRVWRIGERAMTPEQQQELRDLINQWRAEHPKDTEVANVRLEDWGSSRQRGTTPGARSSGSLLTLLSLDPLAGMGPAQREVAKSRMLAERVFFFTSRSADILKWNVEILYQNLLRAPEFGTILESMKRASDSTVRFGDLATELPERVAEQRELALNQFFSQLRQERTATVEQLSEAISQQRREALQDIEAAQGKFKGTLAEFRETAAVTEQLAERLTTFAHAADGLVARFTPDPAAPKPTRAPTGEPERDGVKEFGAMAERTGDAAERLTLLAKSINDLLASPVLNQKSDAVAAAVAEVQMGSSQLVDRVFWRLLILAVAGPFSIVAAAIAYRVVVRKV